METVQIIDATPDNLVNYGVCGYKDTKHEELSRKIDWFGGRFKEGMKIKILYSEKDGTQGMLEYIPGKYCWRPVEASGYMFIHCIFVGFRKEYKGKGYGSLMIDKCMEDAKKQKMAGVAMVTRKGPFMAGNELFLKKGFKVVDRAEPDFELLVKKFSPDSPDPKFKGNWDNKASKYGDGLVMIRSDQCPYSVKNIQAMVETAEKVFHLKPIVIDLKSYMEAQESPSPFGTFCILYNGKVISHHPISNTRFINIMSKILA
jgi:GNAT superfamily N-acetyltransferase